MSSGFRKCHFWAVVLHFTSFREFAVCWKTLIFIIRNYWNVWVVCFEFSVMSITRHFEGYTLHILYIWCCQNSTNILLWEVIFALITGWEGAADVLRSLPPGPSLEQAYFLNLHMDNRKIFRVSNDEEGVTALMSWFFFIFNIVYGRKAFNNHRDWAAFSRREFGVYQRSCSGSTTLKILVSQCLNNFF